MLTSLARGYSGAKSLYGPVSGGMGFVDSETVRVLEEGFVPPSALERGQTAAFARWIRRPFGAVLFIRRWQDGMIDTDLAVTSCDEQGRWREPAGSSGGGWYDPFHRPVDGWDGIHVRRGGMTGAAVGDGDDEAFIRVFKGMASPRVAKLDTFDSQGNLFDEIQMRPETGVFIAGVIGESSYTLVARAADGSAVDEVTC